MSEILNSVILLHHKSDAKDIKLSQQYVNWIVHSLNSSNILMHSMVHGLANITSCATCKAEIISIKSLSIGLNAHSAKCR